MSVGGFGIAFTSLQQLLFVFCFFTSLQQLLSIFFTSLEQQVGLPQRGGGVPAQDCRQAA